MNPLSPPYSPRAQSFHSLTGSDLASWMSSIGLEMYAELISQLVVTGERLASIAANSEDLVVRYCLEGAARGRGKGNLLTI